MRNNPFTSITYSRIWSKHFGKGKPVFSFDFIENVSFVKYLFLPLYVNVGKNLTKGIFYSLNKDKSDYKGKTFLVYDVPSYFNVAKPEHSKDETLGLKRIYQYSGYLMDVSSFNTYEDYINSQFSSKNRREFKSNIRRLETCFNIKYSFLFGTISKDEFDKVFNDFNELLHKRFSGKKTNYHHLKEKKWKFYRELVFEMLSEKRASMLVIYNDDKPIGITLNFHSEKVLFETITVFDLDYYKFSIGKTSIIKLLEWCFENGYKVSDFSKGDFDYKHKWANLEYDFHYHILYDTSSFKSRFIAKCIQLFFRVKLYLRQKNINSLYRKFVFKLKGSYSKKNSSLDFKVEKLTNFDESIDFNKIDYKNPRYSNLLHIVYSFLFANPEYHSGVVVFQSKSNKKEFVIKGADAAQKVILY